MTGHGQMEHAPGQGSGTGETAPSWADMLDPEALRARLDEARVRREAALRARADGVAGGPRVVAQARPRVAEQPVPVAAMARGPRPVLSPAAVPVKAPVLVADARPAQAVAGDRSAASRLLLVGAVFAAGLVAGSFATLTVPAPEQVAAGVPASGLVPSSMMSGPVAPAVPVVSDLSGVDAFVAVVPRIDAPSVGPGDLGRSSAGEALLVASAIPLPRIGAVPPVLVGPAVAQWPKVPGGEIDLASLEAPNAPFGAAGEAGIPEQALVRAEPVAAVPSSGLGSARVVLHFQTGAGDRADAALARLRARDVAEASAVAVLVPVSRSNVRYFHPEDRAAAEATARLVAGDGAVPEVRDFTDFSPKPDPGLIEVWMRGEGVPVAARKAEPRGTALAAARDAGRGAASDRDAETVHRILLERSVERMLKEQIRQR